MKNERKGGGLFYFVLIYPFCVCVYLLYLFLPSPPPSVSLPPPPPPAFPFERHSFPVSFRHPSHLSFITSPYHIHILFSPPPPTSPTPPPTPNTQQSELRAQGQRQRRTSITRVDNTNISPESARSALRLFCMRREGVSGLLVVLVFECAFCASSVPLMLFRTRVRCDTKKGGDNTVLVAISYFRFRSSSPLLLSSSPPLWFRFALYAYAYTLSFVRIPSRPLHLSLMLSNTDVSKI